MVLLRWRHVRGSLCARKDGVATDCGGHLGTSVLEVTWNGTFIFICLSASNGGQLNCRAVRLFGYRVNLIQIHLAISWNAECVELHEGMKSASGTVHQSVRTSRFTKTIKTSLTSVAVAPCPLQYRCISFDRHTVRPASPPTPPAQTRRFGQHLRLSGIIVGDTERGYGKATVGYDKITVGVR